MAIVLIDKKTRELSDIKNCLFGFENRRGRGALEMKYFPKIVIHTIIKRINH